MKYVSILMSLFLFSCSTGMEEDSGYANIQTVQDEQSGEINISVTGEFAEVHTPRITITVMNEFGDKMTEYTERLNQNRNGQSGSIRDTKFFSVVSSVRPLLIEVKNSSSLLRNTCIYVNISYENSNQIALIRGNTNGCLGNNQNILYALKQ